MAYVSCMRALGSHGRQGECQREDASTPNFPISLSALSLLVSMVGTGTVVVSPYRPQKKMVKNTPNFGYATSTTATEMVDRQLPPHAQSLAQHTQSERLTHTQPQNNQHPRCLNSSTSPIRMVFRLTDITQRMPSASVRRSWRSRLPLLRHRYTNQNRAQKEILIRWKGHKEFTLFLIRATVHV